MTDILGRLALMPYGEDGTIPHDWRTLARYYPRGECVTLTVPQCDCQNGPGSGSKLYHINSWAMFWSSDRPRDARWPTSYKNMSVHSKVHVMNTTNFFVHYVHTY